jgi:hypothetical protein
VQMTGFIEQNTDVQSNYCRADHIIHGTEYSSLSCISLFTKLLFKPSISDVDFLEIMQYGNFSMM